MTQQTKGQKFLQWVNQEWTPIHSTFTMHHILTRTAPEGWKYALEATTTQASSNLTTHTTLWANTTTRLLASTQIEITSNAPLIELFPKDETPTIPLPITLHLPPPNAAKTWAQILTTP